ncbi:hypothetical protein [Mumia zhuanghuii]|uniref:Uncharacterized protein n=1 Tax=Mumia zhuanghuii TaxID=2585211 RepID=A0A5C4M384_9ACTN|nr:hypothetical protein [Mumia zhuanghuii]TNC26846.1 hypothetical protein FHE65_34465 [Mumia zhuanghuii]
MLHGSEHVYYALELSAADAEQLQRWVLGSGKRFSDEKPMQRRKEMLPLSGERLAARRRESELSSDDSLDEPARLDALDELRLQ